MMSGDLPTFIKKKYRGSSRSFRRKPIRRSLQRPKITSQIIEDPDHIRPHLSALPRTSSKYNKNIRIKDLKGKQVTSPKNPFKLSPERVKTPIKKSEIMPSKIIPSESYARIIGSSINVKSSTLPVTSRVKTRSVHKKHISEPKESQTKQLNSKISKLKKAQSSNKLSQIRSEIQEKYKKQNSMSHTPDIRSKRRLSDRKPQLTRSITTDLKQLRAKPNTSPISLPFITTPIQNRKFTLVLDLDETLIHFKNIPGKSKFLIRPHCYKFLRNLHSHFEIIIFTAAQQQYADWIIDKIDPKVVPNG